MESALLTELTTSLKGLDIHEQQAVVDYSNHEIQSVYFGGGTPSLARPQVVERVLSLLRNQYKLLETAEVTLEANASSMDFSRLADFKSAGINRLSIGLQSLRDNHLKMMGRDHSATEARDATLTAAKLFPNRFTADLIYGIPGQSLKEWRHDLFEITTQLDSPAHLSLYQLILERGTPLHRSIFRDKTLTLPDEEVLADMWEATVEIAHSNNYQQYEVSSFALNGLKENKSVHNQGYWSGHDFIGVGPGAHGRITSVKSSRFRTFRILDPNQWMAKCESSGSGMRKTVEMTRSEIMAELLVFGLRTADGVCPETFWKYSGGVRLDEYLQLQVLVPFLKQGLLEQTAPRGVYGPGLRASFKGLSVLDRILPDLIPGVEKN